jgi:hypothetical protein
MFPIRPNRQRAKEIVVTFYVYIAFSILNIALSAWQYFLYQDYIDHPDNQDIEVAELSDSLNMVSGVLTVVLSMTTIVMFIRWFRRAYYNLHAIRSSEATMEEGWAAGAWFIPFLNLYRPYQIMREIWVGTQRAMPHRYPDMAPASLVGVWWTLYIIMNVSSNISYRVATSVDDLEGLVNLATTTIVIELLSIAAAAVAIQLIRRVSSFEDALWDEVHTPSDDLFALNATISVPAAPEVTGSAPAS